MHCVRPRYQVRPTELPTAHPGPLIAPLHTGTAGGLAALVTALVAALRRADPVCQHSECQHYAALTLSNLAFYSAAARSEIAAVPGALAALAAPLCTGNRQEALSSADALHHLCEDDEANQLAVAQLPGVLPALVQLLQSDNESAMCYLAALESITANNPLTQSMLLRSVDGCVAAVAALLRRRATQVNALLLLSILAEADQAAVLAAVPAGGVLRLVRLLCSDDPALAAQQDVARAAIGAFHPLLTLQEQDGSALRACNCCGAAGWRLKCCTGCWEVAYCGVECQKRGWKGGHTHVCALLAMARAP